MLPITGPRKLLSRLDKFDRTATVQKLASLLTFPELHANTIRLELLVHLACIHCHGSKTPSQREIKDWLNVQLGNSDAARWEDPVEDVFIHNVMVDTGNRRIFEGIWESNGAYLQEILDATFFNSAPAGSRDLHRSILGLLTMSEHLANTLGLSRWTMGGGHPHSEIELPTNDAIVKNVAGVTFSAQGLADIGIGAHVLEPFIIPDRLIREMAKQTVGHSHLERHPLICDGNQIIIALPTAISIAIRRYLLEWLDARGMLGFLEKRLRLKQSQFVFDELRAHAGLVPIQPHVFPAKPDGFPDCDEMLGRFDEDKLCHVVVIPDSLKDAREKGLSSERTFHDKGDLVSTYVRDVVNDLRIGHPGTNGFTVVIMGGVGRGFTFALNEVPLGWRVLAFGLEALADIVRVSESSLLRIWKLKREEERVESHGVTIVHPWGDLNLYAYWKGQGYTLIHRDMEYPGQLFVSLSSGFVATVREEIRMDYDLHAVPLPTGAYSRVCRINPNAYFEVTRRLPVYLDLWAIQSGTLRGVVETVRGPWWLTVIATPKTHSNGGRRLQYGLWDALLSWLGKLAPVLDRYCHTFQEPMQIVVTLQHLDSWQDLTGLNEDALLCAELSFAIEGSSIAISVPKTFRAQFNKPENIAERILLETITRGALNILHQKTGVAFQESFAQTIVSEIMPNDDMRIIHFFEARDPGTQLAGIGAIPKPRFIQQEDHKLCGLGLASRIDPSIARGTLSGKSACLSILNNGVSKLWQELESQLKGFNRLSLVTMALSNNESLLRDRAHWSETSRALLAIHSNPKNVHDVSHRHEVDRIRASLANRILIEMAICVAPTSGGASSSKEALDLLSARIITLIEMAYLSDAIKYDLAPPQIQIRNNGFIEAERDFSAETLNRYGSETFREQFKYSAEIYNSKYEPRPSSATISEGLDEAFKDEYGLKVSEYYDVLTELWDCAIEQSSAVITLSIADLRDRLRKNRTLPDTTIESFIKSFVLHPRERWDQVPNGFDDEDFQPWRYQRRLSVSMRPVVNLDSSQAGLCIYGIQTAGESMDYVLGRIRGGWLDTETVTSSLMKSYIGKVADEKGEEFEKEVAKHFDGHQWKTRHRLQISALGGPPDLGDIDVMTWKADGSRTIAIECKRLKPARTVGEIGAQLAKFKGEERDRLARHVERLKWLDTHVGAVRNKLGIPEGNFPFESLLVTNVIVPMQYVTDLPITPERVLPIDKLEEFLSN